MLQKPHDYGHEDGTRVKGDCFRPRQRGNTSGPTPWVDNESGVGQFSMRWCSANRGRPKDGAAGFARRRLLFYVLCRPVCPLSSLCALASQSVCGFPSRFRPRRQKPHGYGREAGTGAKGGCFRPDAKRGNHSGPTRPVDNESGVGHFLCVGQRQPGTAQKRSGWLVAVAITIPWDPACLLSF